MVFFLPNEIWSQIFSHFKVVLYGLHRDLEPLKTLTALSLVSRRFHDLAQTPLYQTVLLWGINDYYSEDHHGPHFHLAKALANNPQLGLSTREISLTHGNLPSKHNLMSFLGDQIESPNISSEFIDLLKRDIIFGWRGSGVASFLLALMPRVRLVELYFYKEPSMSLPYILGGRLSYNSGEPHTVANHLHHLQELRITSAQAQTWLEVFTVSAGSRSLARQTPYIDWNVDLNEFGDVLRELGQNLVKLELVTRSYRHVLGLDVSGKVGSLQSLKSLKHLSISRNDFVGAEDDPTTIPLVEALPTSIEVMDFREDVTDSQMRQAEYGYEKMHDEIYGLAVGGQFPGLRKITLFRRGIPTKHRFQREVPGWDVEDMPPCVNGPLWEALKHPYYTYLTLYMQRRDDGSEGVQDS
ncbi:uncharacterized protein NECHADRAFT_86731 [Fusarium vanettenii 77-13-4]|uniref:F-box domain-containing protein n=1 Tax=Fusarium vanettenii (strain ATCC MYA-4622 / CBS 123669 / FGSC 9596 / NRRL 45880 / 77-13-4) TaxID=660122 RepID=C7ZG88_FUSV7|nr:uncharacterized protein NECHADRAFT_86731 [Fusarium vanettenii 77-13-4]EEU37122.1 predicted protein [Fusarium vanettenii 77-13-4]